MKTITTDAANTPAITKFDVGKTYVARPDVDTELNMTVVKRTNCYVSFVIEDGEFDETVYKRKVVNVCGIEKICYREPNAIISEYEFSAKNVVDNTTATVDENVGNLTDSALDASNSGLAAFHTSESDESTHEVTVWDDGVVTEKPRHEPETVTVKTAEDAWDILDAKFPGKFVISATHTCWDGIKTVTFRNDADKLRLDVLSDVTHGGAIFQMTVARFDNEIEPVFEIEVMDDEPDTEDNADAKT